MRQDKRGGGYVSGEIYLTSPSSLRKHGQSQKNDGQTGSLCLDKAVLACRGGGGGGGYAQCTHPQSCDTCPLFA